MIYSSSCPRQVSLPLDSNGAVMARITRELKKLNSLEESSTSAAETIGIGLSGIADLYKCVVEMLTFPLTRKSLSLRQHKKCVGELLEVSSKLLEVCGFAKEMARQMKVSSEDLRSDLGRDLGSKESSVARFVCSRKEIAKKSKEIRLLIKRIGGEGFVSFGSSDDDVIQVLRCINIIGVSVLENLLVFLGLKPKSGGQRSIFYKLMRKGRVAEGGDELRRNELENLDLAICGMWPGSEEKRKLVRKRLEKLESGVEGIQCGLESVFKQLTLTRVLLHKILRGS